VLSAAIDAVSTQSPAATLVTVVPDRVQIPAPDVRAHVIAPVPLLPEVLTVATEPGRIVLDEADAVMVCDAREIVNVAATAPASNRVVEALVAVTWH